MCNIRQDTDQTESADTVLRRYAADLVEIEHTVLECERSQRPARPNSLPDKLRAVIQAYVRRIHALETENERVVSRLMP